MIGVAYTKLNDKTKLKIQNNLQFRREQYEKFVLNSWHAAEFNDKRILIVGDRPGPSAPKDPGYHHTPFYSTKHCSGWLNALLEICEIPEWRLVWINAADKDGAPTDNSIIDRIAPHEIICLGGNAEKWVKLTGRKYFKVDHPQYHKRFKNKLPYPLIDLLKDILG